MHSVTSIVIVLCVLATLHAYVTRIEQCEPIQIPRCRAMPYNMTQMPNLMHHNTQENAKLVFEKFEILIDQHCSDVLLFLLCSIYVPICAVTLQPEAIPPCRSVCERARAGCEPLMNSYNVSWPDSLECSHLPRYERGVCVSPDAFVKPTKKKRKKGCKCKRKKPSWRLFRKYQYDYAIRGHILKRKRINQRELVYKVKVSQVLFCGKVKFPLSNDVTLWVNSSCACPTIRKGREYLILGHEDKQGNKLMLNQLSIAFKWRNSWPRRIKKWQYKAEMRRRRRRQKRIRQSRVNQPGNSHGTGKPKGQHKKNQKRQNGILSPSPKQTSPTDFTHFVNGYTHGGRYYPKDLAKKYNLAVPGQSSKE